MDFLIVGGSHGIGRATTEALSVLGATVHVISREGTDLAALPRVTHYSYDVITKEGTLPDVEALSGFAYFPGSIPLKPFEQIKRDDFQAALQINFLAGIDLLQRYLPPLKKGKGSVLFVSSVAAQTGFPFHAAISAAKGAVEGFVKAFAAEYAPTLRCNAIAPSLVETGLSEQLISSDEKKQNAVSRHPLGRIGTPEDVANLATFLLSDKSEWITGQIFHIDGGLSSLRK